MGLDGGAERDRTVDLVIANDALFQLSYGPYSDLWEPTSMSRWHKKILSHSMAAGIV